MKPLAKLSLEALQQELSRQVQIRDALLLEALDYDRATFAADSDEVRSTARQHADNAMKRLQVQNYDVVWPLEAEISRRAQADD